MPSDIEIGIYRDAVISLIEMDSDKVILNGKPEHAAVLYECFFKHAKDEILIFCETLSNEVFGRNEVVQEARAALERNVSISIISKKDPEPGDFNKFILESTGNTFLQYKTRTELCAIKSDFAVVDKKRYRFEEDSSQTRAIACMNSPAFANKLADVFHSL